MPINVQWGPPPSMMATAAMQAGYLKGDVERRRFGAELGLKRQQLQLQAQRTQMQTAMQMRQLQGQEAGRQQRMIEGLLARQAQEERQQLQATQQEYMQNIGAEDELLEEIDQKIARGEVKRDATAQQELDQIDSAEATWRKRYAEGEIDRETYMDGMNKYAQRRRILRRNVIPIPENERPPVFTWPDGEEQRPTELKVRGGVTYALRNDGKGNWYPLQIGPDYPNTKEGKEAEVRIKAEAEAKERTEKLDQLEHEARIKEIDAERAVIIKEHTEDLKQWNAELAKAEAEAIAAAEEHWKREHPPPKPEPGQLASKAEAKEAQEMPAHIGEYARQRRRRRFIEESPRPVYQNVAKILPHPRNPLLGLQPEGEAPEAEPIVFGGKNYWPVSDDTVRDEAGQLYRVVIQPDGPPRLEPL